MPPAITVAPRCLASRIMRYPARQFPEWIPTPTMSPGATSVAVNGVTGTSSLVGDPVIIDVPVTPFTATDVAPGDIVGVGIHSGNCLAGYRIIREAKQRGATVIAGGIHPSLFPEEALQMGADAVVKGGGDLIWSK